MVSTREKILLNSWNEGFVQKGFVSTRRKKTFAGRILNKIYKKRFVLATKSVFTTWKEAFVEKHVSSIRKDCFFWQKHQRKWFLLTGKCFFLKVGSL